MQTNLTVLHVTCLSSCSRPLNSAAHHTHAVSVVRERTVTITTVSEGLKEEEEDRIFRVTLKSQDDLRNLLQARQAQGMYTVADKTTLITQIEQLEAGEVYYFVAPIFDVIKEDKRWRQVEDRALEDEVNECVLASLPKGLELRDDLRQVRKLGAEHCIWQEWDGVMINGKELLLIETKRAGTQEHLELLKKRRDTFVEELTKGTLLGFSDFKQIFAVVLGGSHFPR